MDDERKREAVSLAHGRSISQPPPGATGEHANPVGPGERSVAARVLRPGDVLHPRPHPHMPATGAADGPHPPAPGAGDQRIAQHDWDRWRAEDRRALPFDYPHWRT